MPGGPAVPGGYTSGGWIPGRSEDPGGGTREVPGQ